MKSNKRIFEENNKDMRDKVTNMNYNSKTTMRSTSKKGIPVAEKNTNLAKNDIKESQNKGDKNSNLNVSPKINNKLNSINIKGHINH